MHSLVGLTRNHLNVIGQSCPGGLPEEHKIVILAAAKQLSFGRSALGITAGQSAFASSAASVQPKLPVEADQQAVAQQAPQRKGTNRLASHGLDSSASSSSSFASDSETYTSLNASRGSTARHVVQQVPNRLASGPDKPAPSHSQLQVLYSQMEADYKRLQDRSAQSSASSHRPPQPLISGISAAAGANRQGKRSPPPVASSPASKDKASAGSGQGPAPVQVAAGTPLSAAGLQQAEATAAGMANRSNQRSNPVGGRGSSAVGADHRVHGAEGALRGAGGRLEGVAASQVGQSKASPGRVQRVSAAAAVKQMRKQKRVLPVEPFVQVFTNFHTHSKVSNVPEKLLHLGCQHERYTGAPGI